MIHLSSSKKSLTHAATVVIIAAIIVLIIMLSLLQQIFDTAENQFQRAGCPASVAQHALLNEYALESFSRNLNCPANELLITKEASQELTRDFAFRKIADEMNRCWSDYGKGQLNLFKEEAVYCDICAFVEFDDDVKSNSFEGFNQFLANNRASGSTRTYADEMMGTETKEFADVFDNPSSFRLNTKEIQGDFDPKKLHSVVFVYARGKETMEEIKDLYGGSDKLLWYSSGTSIAAGTATAAVLVMATPIGWTASLVAGAGLGLGGVGASLSSYFAEDPPEWAAATTVIEYDAEHLLSLGCRDIRLDTKETR